MSFELYDYAMKKKLESIFENVIMAPPEKAFKRSNEEGKVKLPLISVWRLSNPPDWENYNHAEAFYGRYNQRNDKGYVLTQGIPVIITYQIDIWASQRSHADGIYRELVFYMLQYPNLVLDIPTTDSPNGLDFSMRLTDVETATDYDEVDDRNMIHRYTLTYEIPYARMFMEGKTIPYIKKMPIDVITENYLGQFDDQEHIEVTVGEGATLELPEEHHGDPYSDGKDPIRKKH